MPCALVMAAATWLPEHNRSLPGAKALLEGALQRLGPHVQRVRG
eukprot:CAMPEP_0202880818 /NCGR_PEP_ID=MMETSP1391-20130828/35591_1 /ASSEMBLY_ACC=CAM_ASM_000867 /TAXON_ID=1034604 /ORGANISM="Chlamydomonas leiostraca, Strain SAG 11-49" /LENGTH=43 /DNA_ID= /DNA_START= /DNA_END= /DNA_ORIENTATION=